MENKDKGQLFVSMPRYKSSERDECGTTVYKDVCNPITAEFREELYANILEEFERVKEQGQTERGRDGEVEMPQFSVTVHLLREKAAISVDLPESILRTVSSSTM